MQMWKERLAVKRFYAKLVETLPKAKDDYSPIESQAPQAQAENGHSGKASAPSKEKASQKALKLELDRRRIENEAHHNQITDDLQENIGKAFMCQLETKEKLKKWFFGITMVTLVASLVFVGFILVRVTKGLNGHWEGFAAFVTALVGGITALLALPNIIAQYLFDKNEHESIYNLLSQMIRRDKPSEKKK